MPTAAPRVCTSPGCRAFGVLVGRCEAHARPAWQKPVTATKRITGRRLQAMRKALFMRCPLCVMCTELGRVTEATQRDHVVPLAEGGADDESNEQGLCESCHEGKSIAEAIRGRRRAR